MTVATGRGVWLTDIETEGLFEAYREGRIHVPVLYMYFRQQMDVKTRVAGLSRRINTKALTELLERRPKVGSNWSGKAVDDSVVRRQLKYMCEPQCFLGGVPFFVRRGPLVFELPMAVCEYLPSQEASREGRHFSINKNTLDSEGCNKSMGKADREAQHTSYTYPPPMRDLSFQPQALVAVYNDSLAKGNWSRLIAFSPDLLVLLHDAIQVYPKAGNIDWWPVFFKKVAKSDWLMGRIGRRGSTFSGNFRWLLAQGRIIKILNGDYE